MCHVFIKLEGLNRSDSNLWFVKPATSSFISLGFPTGSWKFLARSRIMMDVNETI